MSNIQAAIGCAQLERIDELVARKQEIFAHYKTTLSELPGISMNPQTEGSINGVWMPTVVFDAKLGIDRERLQESFRRESIDARVFFWPLSSLPPFVSDHLERNTIAYDIPNRAINLPSYHDIGLEELERVASVIKALYQE
jgi:perosamine synthetase